MPARNPLKLEIADGIGHRLLLLTIATHPSQLSIRSLQEASASAVNIRVTTGTVAATVPALVLQMDVKLDNNKACDPADQLQFVYPVDVNENMCEVFEITKLADLKAIEFLSVCKVLNLDPYEAQDKTRLVIKAGALDSIRGQIRASSQYGAKGGEVDEIRGTLSSGVETVFVTRSAKILETFQVFNSQVESLRQRKNGNESAGSSVTLTTSPTTKYALEPAISSPEKSKTAADTKGTYGAAEERADTKTKLDVYESSEKKAQISNTDISCKSLKKIAGTGKRGAGLKKKPKATETITDESSGKSPKKSGKTDLSSQNENDSVSQDTGKQPSVDKTSVPVMTQHVVHVAQKPDGSVSDAVYGPSHLLKHLPQNSTNAALETLEASTNTSHRRTSDIYGGHQGEDLVHLCKQVGCLYEEFCAAIAKFKGTNNHSTSTKELQDTGGELYPSKSEAEGSFGYSPYSSPIKETHSRDKENGESFSDRRSSEMDSVQVLTPSTSSTSQISIGNNDVIDEVGATPHICDKDPSECNHVRIPQSLAPVKGHHHEIKEESQHRATNKGDGTSLRDFYACDKRLENFDIASNEGALSPKFEYEWEKMEEDLTDALFAFG